MDAETFAAEARALHRHLVRTAYLLSGDAGLAEESAQEGLARAWARVEAGASIDSLGAWTTTATLNWCRTQLRRRGAEGRALSRLLAIQPRDGIDPVEPGSEVHRAVLALPLRQREVVVRHYFLDEDLATIAAAAGITTGSVKNALFHARAALAAALGEPADDGIAGNETAGNETAGDEITGTKTVGSRTAGSWAVGDRPDTGGHGNDPIDGGPTDGDPTDGDPTDGDPTGAAAADGRGAAPYDTDAPTNEGSPR